jgi:hypothetical protein
VDQVATHHPGEPSRHRQADAHGGGLGARVIAPHELPEDAISDDRVDAVAIIGDPDDHRTPVVGRIEHDRRSAMAPGVGEHIPEDLAQPQRIGPRHHIPVGDVDLAGERRRQVCEMAHHLDANRLDRQIADVGPLEGQQVVDQPCQLLALAEDDRGDLPHLGAGHAIDVGMQFRCEAQHRREGCSQLVTDRRYEATPGVIEGQQTFPGVPAFPVGGDHLCGTGGRGDLLGRPLP